MTLKYSTNYGFSGIAESGTREVFIDRPAILAQQQERVDEAAKKGKDSWRTVRLTDLYIVWDSAHNKVQSIHEDLDEAVQAERDSIHQGTFERFVISFGDGSAHPNFEARSHNATMTLVSLT